MKTVFSYSLVVFLLLCAITPKSARAVDDRTPSDALRMTRASAVDKEDLNRVLAVAERHHVSNEFTARWIARIRNTAQEGLPTSPLISKIEEGLAKNIEAGRIDAALERMMDGLRFTSALMAKDPEAHSALTPVEHQRVLIRMNELLSAGVAKTEMSRLYDTWAPAAVEQKLEALTFFAVAKQAGLKPDEAYRIASAGIEHNHFHSFPLNLAMMIKAAKANHIETTEIVGHALKVIRGEQTVTQAHRQMGIQQMHPNPDRDSQGQFRSPGFRGSGDNGSRSGGSSGGHGGGHGRGGRGR